MVGKIYMDNPALVGGKRGKSFGLTGSNDAGNNGIGHGLKSLLATLSVVVDINTDAGPLLCLGVQVLGQQKLERRNSVSVIADENGGVGGGDVYLINVVGLIEGYYNFIGGGVTQLGKELGQ